MLLGGLPVLPGRDRGAARLSGRRKAWERHRRWTAAAAQRRAGEVPPDGVARVLPQREQEEDEEALQRVEYVRHDPVEEER